MNVKVCASERVDPVTARGLREFAAREGWTIADGTERVRAAVPDASAAAALRNATAALAALRSVEMVLDLHEIRRRGRELEARLDARHTEMDRRDAEERRRRGFGL